MPEIIDAGMSNLYFTNMYFNIQMSKVKIIHKNKCWINNT